MNRHQTEWSALARIYNPLAAGSIDGTDEDPHDRGIIRAMSAKYKPNQGVQGGPQSTVFVAQLNHITTEDTLQMVFSQYGQIKRLRIIRDVVTGFSKGYAFVEYEDERDAVIAQREANGQELDDKKLFVDFENERMMPGWIPRRLGGGFGGKRESGQLRFGGRARPFKKPLLAAGLTGEKQSDSGNFNSYKSVRDDSDQRRNDTNRNQRYRSFDHRDRSRSPSRSHDSHRRRRRSRSRSKTRDRYRQRSRSLSRNRESYKRR